MSERVTVIGGGLAGSEAAYHLAQAGVGVDLYEMRPCRSTDAHKTDRLAELVCSNSFRDNSTMTAVGVLKREMRAMGSLVMKVADEVAVPAGSALAVDRVRFAEGVTAAVEGLDSVTIHRQELLDIPDGPVCIVATGPLTSPELSRSLARFIGTEHLYFYDAISPIITADSVDRTRTFRASRYNKGGDDYVNCPLDQETYEGFIDALMEADKVPLKSFERCTYFEGCMPVEELARRGRDTLRFGPMKPVGLQPPDGSRPHAVVQLRQDDREGRLLSMVGFQTKMTYGEQRRVFRSIPGMEAAEFVRLGSLHRNTFINSPRALTRELMVRGSRGVFVAGQLVGVEGYVESAASGMLCGFNAARLLGGLEPASPPSTTALGSLLDYVTERSRREFQPMNANYGLFPPLGRRLRGREKKKALGSRAEADLHAWMSEVPVGNPERLCRTSS